MADGNNAIRLFRILEILQKHSDKNHPLSQQDIIKMLWSKYEIHADRKTIKRNIVNLEELGFDIEYATADRSKGTEAKNTVTSKYYMNNEFDDSELRLLIDSVLYSPNISACQSKQLIQKLQNQSSEYFKSHTKHIVCMPSRKSENKQLFHTIEIIDEAISKKKMISFKHLYYGMDMQLHIEKGINARKNRTCDLKWMVSPYQMIMSDGIYYLECGYLNKEIKHLRLDEISEIKMLEEMAHPINTMLDEEDFSKNFRTYLVDKRVFTPAGSPVGATLRVRKSLFHIVPKAFGKDVTVISAKGEYAEVRVRAPKSEIIEFAMKHLEEVLVVAPEEIATDIKMTIKIAYENYQEITKLKKQ